MISDTEKTLLSQTEALPLVAQLMIVEDYLKRTTVEEVRGPRLLHDTNEGTGPLTVIPVKESTPENGMIFGRGNEVSYQVLDADLSREHFKVFRSGENCFLIDLDSSNGVTINSNRVSSRALVSGDLIFAGGQVFLFLDDETAP